MRPVSQHDPVDNRFEEASRRHWSSHASTTLTRSVSPPPVSRSKSGQSKSLTALVEAGEKEVADHLTFFSQKLQAATISSIGEWPRLDHSSWVELYQKTLNREGHHFVVHQHDHPVAGTHYDLRLQCNATSSISFAIMYGLPGDPNSRRLNRNATETRVHNLWNHLMETASHQTGTMLLWDTGEYEVLPYYEQRHTSATTDEDVSSDSDYRSGSLKGEGWSTMTEQQKLHVAFKQRKIRLRLNGTKLPQGYTISLRLTSDNYRWKQPDAPKKRRGKQIRGTGAVRKRPKVYSTDSSSSEDNQVTGPTSLRGFRSISSLVRHASPPPNQATINSSSSSSEPDEDLNPNSKPSHNSPGDQPQIEHDINEPGSQHSDNENDHGTKEELEIQRNNAYPGATNDINSIHQRRWYLSLDRKSSGFVRTRSGDGNNKRSGARPHWVPRSSLEDYNKTTTARGRQSAGFAAFHVLGRDHERSIVTGRLARDILTDEGVEGYIPRGFWRAVTE